MSDSYIDQNIAGEESIVHNRAQRNKTWPMMRDRDSHAPTIGKVIVSRSAKKRMWQYHQP